MTNQSLSISNLNLILKAVSVTKGIKETTCCWTEKYYSRYYVMFPNFNIQTGYAKARDVSCQEYQLCSVSSQTTSLNCGHHENFKNYIVKMWFIATYDDDMSTIWLDKRPHYITMPYTGKRTIHKETWVFAQLHFNTLAGRGVKFENKHWYEYATKLLQTNNKVAIVRNQQVQTYRTIPTDTQTS